MRNLINAITECTVTIAVIVVGYYGTKLMAYVSDKVNLAKEKDKLGIVEMLTQKAVQYAEEEFGSGKGEEKKEFAIKKATEFLKDKGIDVSKDVINAGISAGVQQLHQIQGKYNTLLEVESPDPLDFGNYVSNYSTIEQHADYTVARVGTVGSKGNISCDKVVVGSIKDNNLI